MGELCAAVSQALEGSQAEIEVASIDLGGQVEKQWAPLIGISSTPRTTSSTSRSKTSTTS